MYKIHIHTAADKEKAKATVKKHAKNVKACKEAITAAEEEVSEAMAKIFSTTGNFFWGDRNPRGTKSSPNKPSVTCGSISEESSTVGTLPNGFTRTSPLPRIPSSKSRVPRGRQLARLPHSQPSVATHTPAVRVASMA
eukprot:scaffold37874_cov42-Cyclotella_meneghiniana.AAC.12